MACLALVLQPQQGPDLLLQTKNFFPTCRAIEASEQFRSTRHADGVVRQREATSLVNQDRLGDDPIATASGQVLVGRHVRHRVVYRLVNSIYVLAISPCDEDDSAASLNVFDCTTAVNQAVSVLVTACRGVDVTPDKVFRKYTEVYLALHAVLSGVAGARFSSLLSATVNDASSLLSPSPLVAVEEAESKARGAASWNSRKGGAISRMVNVEVLSHASFELPDETLAAGDSAMDTFAPPPPQKAFDKPKAPPSSKPQTAAAAAAGGGGGGAAAAAAVAAGEPDPFSASDSLLSPSQDFSEGLLSSTPSSSSGAAAAAKADPLAQLAGLQVPPAGSSALSPSGGGDAFDFALGGEGEEDFDAEDAFGGSGLLGDDGDAWGGGLDASEFGAAPAGLAEVDASGRDSRLVEPEAAGGPSLLSIGGPGTALEAALGGSLAPLPLGTASSPGAGLSPGTVRAAAQGGLGREEEEGEEEAIRVPRLVLREEISAEFKGTGLLRIRLQGQLVLDLPALPPLPMQQAAAATASAAEKDVDFSFKLEGSGVIHRAVLRESLASSLGRGFFHLKVTSQERRAMQKEQQEQEDLRMKQRQQQQLLDMSDNQETALPAPPVPPPSLVLLKYRLKPRLTPVPLRMRLVTRRSEDALSLMVQYVANPFLPVPLTNVVFTLSLPFSPASIRVSPSAQLDPHSKELRWRVPSIEPKAPPQRLRAQIPIIPPSLIHPPNPQPPTEEEKQAEEDRIARELACYRVRVQFNSGQGGASLSGIQISHVGGATSLSGGSNAVAALLNEDFSVGQYTFAAKEYVGS